MTTQLYVGNLSHQATEPELMELFSQAGPVEKLVIMKDSYTGQPRGFAFVVMRTLEGAKAAMQRFDGHVINSRAIQVSEAGAKQS